MPMISKSKTGLPNPEFPQGVVLPAEARKARRRLYPVTALYSAYALAILTTALRSGHSRLLTLAFFLGGAAAWTYVEYFAHRHVLHGVFPDGEGFARRFLHRRFDHLHWEHHARPWDGNHINGTVKDTLPFLVVMSAVAFLAPIHTLPSALAGVVQAYILEEWVHHSVHFWSLKGRYFRYIKQHHLYHHSPKGSAVAYGLTNGFWDVVCDTRISDDIRRLLHRQRPPEGEGPGAQG